MLFISQKVININKVITLNRRRRQYGVIAKREDDRPYLIECKKWAGNCYRLSALRGAIQKHEERTEFYRDLTGEEAVPIIVTLIEEDVRICEDMPIVPIFRLNSFINEAISGEIVNTENAYFPMILNLN